MKHIGRIGSARRIVCLVLGALMLAGLVSCGRKPETGDGMPEPAPEMLTGIFSASPLDLPDGYVNEDLRSIPPAPLEDGRILAYGVRFTLASDGWTVQRAEHAVFSLDPAGGEARTVCGFELDAGATVQTGCFAGDSFLFVTWENAVRTLYRADLRTGEIAASVGLEVCFADDGFTPVRLAADGEGNVWAACGAEIAVLSPDLVRRGSLLTDGNVRAFAADRNGSVWMHVGQTISKLDADGPAVGESEELPADASSFWFAPGYDLYYGNASRVWGRSTAEEATLVYSGAASGFVSSEVWPCAVVDAETFLFYQCRPDQSNPALAYAKKQPDLDVSDLEVLRVAVLSSSAAAEYDNLLVGFRREHPEVLVVTEDYTPYFRDSVTGPSDAFLFDWTNNGYRPDAVIASDTDEGYLHLRNRGLFADLRPRLSDGEWDDLFGAVKKAFTEEDGSFVSLCGSFTVSCMIGRAEDWAETDVTAAELLAFAKSLPDGAALTDMEWQDGASASAVFEPVLQTCIDWKSWRADFSDPVFSEMLAYLKTLPKQRNYFGLEEFSFWSERWQLTLDGRVRIGTAALLPSKDPIDWWLGLEGVFGEEDFALLRMALPDGGRTGQISALTYSMTKDAENPEAAWAFIRFLASPENHRNVSGDPDAFAGIPVQKSVFDELAAARVGKRYLIRWRDRAVFKEGSLYGGLGNEPHGEVTLTAETVAAAREFFDTFLDDTRTETIPTAVSGIVSEEVSAYLGGARSAEDCAKIVQSRVDLWLAENKK
ncbi:MAG: extracellular solute-binding protein [Clostridia bacterium]|nr:extracellular solute-binding protein [Clostridia bacterium]